jgi:hypothetical protein
LANFAKAPAVRPIARYSLAWAAFMERKPQTPSDPMAQKNAARFQAAFFRFLKNGTRSLTA